MSEELLIEETGSITSYNSTSIRPGCLGMLNGPIADYENSTRNNRFYGRNLWEKVFETPWVKEALETKTLFGEADHPRDRLETSIKEAAVVLKGYSFDDNNNVLLGEFDILDTPNGRIVKSLADYGCRLGVSSRGKGRIIDSKGKKVVEDRSFVFGGFDVVILPAVEKARQAYVNEDYEPKGFNEIRDQIKEQLEETDSINDLERVKSIIEHTELDESDQLVELVNSRITELSEDANTISTSSLAKDLKDAYDKINKLTKNTDTISESTQQELTEMKDSLNESATTISLLEDELSLYKSRLKNSSEDNEYLSERVHDLNGQVDQLTGTKDHLVSENVDLRDRTRELESKIRIESSKFKSYSKRLSEVKEELENSDKERDEVESSYQESISSLNTNVTYLNEDNSELSNRVDDLYETIDEMSNRYLKTVSKLNKVNPNEVLRTLPEEYDLNDIDNSIERIIQRNRRLNKLPIQTEEFQVESVGDRNPSELANTKALLDSMKPKSKN